MDKEALPFTQTEWKATNEFMIKTLSSWNENITEIDEIIEFMRKNFAIFTNSYNDNRNFDIFKGFGIFLMNLNIKKQRDVIKNLMKSVVSFAVKSELVLNVRLGISVTFEALFCQLACSILCLMPTQICSNTQNFNFSRIYANIAADKNSEDQKWLQSILEIFSNLDNSGADNSMTIVPLIKHSSSVEIDSVLAVSSWPCIIMHHDVTEMLHNSFPYMHLWSYISCSRIPPCLSCILLLYYNASPCFIHPSTGPSYIVATSLLDKIDPWNLKRQFSPTHITACISSLGSAVNQAESNLNSRRYPSVSYGFTPAMSLGAKRARSGSSNSSSSELSFRRQSSTMSTRSSRQSYSSSSRSGSLQIAGALIMSSLSSRRSSGKDDEASIGVLESVIEGSGTEGYTLSSQDTQGPSVDLPPPMLQSTSSGICVQQSVIEEETVESSNEESAFHDYGDDWSQMTLAKHIERVLQAPISDSTKLYLSQELHGSFKENKAPVMVHRRNSSPIITGALGQSQSVHCKLYSPLIPPMLTRQPINVETNRAATVTSGNSLFVPERCCGEDMAARLGFLSRRRQSLPCHLQSIMRSHTNPSAVPSFPQKNNASSAIAHPPNFNKRDTGEKQNLSQLGNYLVSEILRWKGRHGLARAILKERTKNTDSMSSSMDHAARDKKRRSHSGAELSKSVIPDSKTPEIQLTEYSNDADNLASQDLAKFDKELFSSSFFDDEADECFRKFSNMVTPNNNEEEEGDANDNGDHIQHASIEQQGDQNNAVMLDSHQELLAGMADKVASGIIIDSLCECRSIGKTPPLVIHPFPAEYDSVLSICIKIIVAGLNRTSDNPRLLILDLPETPNSAERDELLKIIDTIRSIQGSISLAQFYSASLTYFSESFSTRFSEFLREFVTKINGTN